MKNRSRFGVTLVCGLSLVVLVACGTSRAPSGGGFFFADVGAAVDAGAVTGDSTGGDVEADSAQTADAGAVVDGGLTPPDTTSQEPTDEQLKAEGIIKLTEISGIETGEANTDAKGGIAFYSPKHKALVNLEAVTAGKTDAALTAEAGITAHVRVSADGQLWALMVDPTGKLTPTLHVGELKDGQLEVKGEAGIDDGSLAVAYDPNAVSPFKVDKFVGVGVLVSISIRFTLSTMAAMAVTAVVKSVFNKMCLVANPLYTGYCSTLADIAGEIAGIAMGGIKLNLSGEFTWKALGGQAASSAVNFLLGKGCEKAVGATLLALGPTSKNPWPLYDENVGLWKQAMFKTRYIMKKGAEAAPSDPKKAAAAKDVFAATNRLLAVIRPMIQRDVYLIYAGKEAAKVSDGKIYSFLTKQIENIVDELKVVTTQVNLTTLISTQTQYVQYWNAILIQKKTFVVQTMSVRVTEKDWKPKGFSQGFACALGAIDGVGGYISGPQNLGLNITHMQLANDLLKLANALLDEFYGAVWGGAIATPKCYPDLYEPNDKPSPSKSVKNLGTKVTIGDVTSTEGDVDWFSLPLMGPFAKVQAGVAGRSPKGSADCGKVPKGAKLCVSMFWWSNVIDLAGTGPAPIGQEVCKTVSEGLFGGDPVDPQVVVPWWNVSKVTGETNQTLLVRVRQPPGQKMDIPYSVMMFGGSIF